MNKPDWRGFCDAGVRPAWLSFDAGAVEAVGHDVGREGYPRRGRSDTR